MMAFMALPDRPVEEASVFTLHIVQGGTRTTRSVQQTPGLLRGLHALIRELEADTGATRLVQGIPIQPYGHYVWAGEHGAWAVYLTDEDESRSDLSAQRQAALERRQRTRMVWHARHRWPA